MRRIAHAVALVGMSGAALGLLAVPADAHVTVSPSTATKGGYATLTFKVPNERPDANTTTLEVDFPESLPFASVSVQPVAGWGYTVERASLPTPLSNDDGEQITERVAKITWMADGTASQIQPGEFQTFPISAGPLPTNTDSIVLKALQTYSSGEIVRWIEEAAPGSAEAKNPAPKVMLTDAAAPAPGATGTTVTAAPGSGDTAAAVQEAKAAAAAANQAVTDLKASMAGSSTSTDGPTKNQVNTAVGLAIGAIVLALIGAGIGGAALARRPKDEVPPPAGSPSSPPPAF